MKTARSAKHLSVVSALSKKEKWGLSDLGGLAEKYGLSEKTVVYRYCNAGVLTRTGSGKYIRSFESINEAMAKLGVIKPTQIRLPGEIDVQQGSIDDIDRIINYVGIAYKHQVKNVRAFVKDLMMSE